MTTRRWTLIVLLVAALSVVLCVRASAADLADGVVVVSSSQYQSGDYLHIVGEVRNDTVGNVRFVRVTATYFNEAGGVLGTDYSYTHHDILIPGQNSPFRILRLTPPGYARYELAVQYSTTTEVPVAQLAILSTREWTDSLGDLWLVGEVQNTTASTLEFVELIVTLYDLTGTVANMDYGYAYVDLLLPGQKSPFKVLFISGPMDYESRTISTDADTSTSEPPNLRCTNVTHYVDGWGWLHFAGQVQNYSATEVKFVQAILTLYGDAGNIINCDFDYTDPSTIPAGGAAVFEMIFISNFAGWSSYALYPPESAVPLPTATSTSTPMPTSTRTATATRTRTATLTPTSTATPTATHTPTRTPTRTPTDTPTRTRTATPTPPLTATHTPTSTATGTSSPTPTSTPTHTLTPTATPPGDLMLSGRVYDAALGPLHGISGATVSAIMCMPRTYQSLSAADGSYSLLLPALYLNQCTSITLEARAAAYQTLSFAIPVAELRAQPVRDLALIPLATPTATVSPVPTPFRVYLPVVVRGAGL